MPPRTSRSLPAAPAAVAELAERAFARAAGSPSTDGNAVRLLCDARENYPAWREALSGAKRYIRFEQYIVENDTPDVTYLQTADVGYDYLRRIRF